MGFWPVVENVLKNSDIVLLVLDARMPELSRNKELERKIINFGKELVYVYTKIDILSPKVLADLRKKYPEGYFVSGTQNLGMGKLRKHVQILAKKLNVEMPRVGVVGYPNIGKSAIINAFARRARTLVADMPGTTRGTQWVRVGGLLVLDSPGVIPYEDKNSKLLILGSKHPHKTHQPEKIACDILQMFLDKGNRKGLFERYKVEDTGSDDLYEILIEIGRKRGYLKKGGEVDETKTAISIISEWQKGKIVL